MKITCLGKRRRVGGKSWNKIVKANRMASKKCVNVVAESPKIVLDKNFVENYLQQQQQKLQSEKENAKDVNDLVHNLSIISINSSDDEGHQSADMSVVFLSTQNATRDEMKIAELNRKVASQENKINNMSVHIRALQTVILRGTSDDNCGRHTEEQATNANWQGEATEDKKTQQTNDENCNVQIEGGATNADFDLTYDEEWVQDQIANFQTEGNFSQVFEDLAKLLCD